MRIQFFVYGLPAPQGSKRHVGNGVMIESSKKVKPWREAVKFAALEANIFGMYIKNSCELMVDFYLPRPKSRKKDVFVTTKPDIDKLLRSTFDALKDSGLIKDDSIICSTLARKRYCNEEFKSPGAFIIVINNEKVDVTKL